jgi:hypothetical protein
VTAPLVVVSRVRFVVPDLDQPRARLRDHVRHAEAAADLDQLPARHDDLLPGPASAAAAAAPRPRRC